MINVQRNRRFGALAAGLAVLTVAAVPALPAAAQSRMTHHRNFAQRHPTMTGAAAGIGAYALAKRTGSNRARAGGHRNFAQRHPILTGIGAGMVAHHYAKKHR